MPRGTNKPLAALTILIFVTALAFVFVVMPRGGDHPTGSFVVKKGTTRSSVACALKRGDLVFSEYLFLLCSLVAYKGRIVAGEYELSPRMSTFVIARMMAYGERNIYTLKIVEGYNLRTISETIEKAGIMDGKSFLQLSRNRNFLDSMRIPADSLEGYLAPDTYFFSKETGVDEFLGKIVRRTFRTFKDEDVQGRMRELHMDMFQVLSLASIIEKEAKLEQEKRLISAVFHNRLRLGMTLDADPTVIYGLENFDHDLKKADLEAPTPYNTYRMKGLPKGPICSPSNGSIVAALYPEKSDVLYFVSKNDGSHVFSRTMKEQNRFVALYQKKRSRNHQK
jgi:UPF0755 protein